MKKIVLVLLVVAAATSSCTTLSNRRDLYQPTRPLPSQLQTAPRAPATTTVPVAPVETGRMEEEEMLPPP